MAMRGNTSLVCQEVLTKSSCKTKRFVRADKKVGIAGRSAPIASLSHLLQLVPLTGVRLAGQVQTSFWKEWHNRR